MNASVALSVHALLYQRPNVVGSIPIKAQYFTLWIFRKQCSLFKFQYDGGFVWVSFFSLSLFGLCNYSFLFYVFFLSLLFMCFLLLTPMLIKNEPKQAYIYDTFIITRRCISTNKMTPHSHHTIPFRWLCRYCYHLHSL